MFIDFHTHRDRQALNLINLQTVDVKPQLQEQDLPNLCSLGLHPWFIEDDLWQAAWLTLEKLASCSQVVAIGECGLDRNVAVPMELQIAVFEKHIQLAESLRKPLVIHCVRAFELLIMLKKNHKSSIPWIIHGFHKKQAVFQQLLGHGFYFSFGAAMLNHDQIAKAIATVPVGRFLLETDDRADLQIEQIYECAAMLRQISLETLQSQLVETYQQLTGLG
ncbi:MAG: hydrolase TatD [Pseudanabaena sp.]|nr:MAG: hydrolase TatD [Pseudanabaena sp.]